LRDGGLQHKGSTDDKRVCQYLSKLILEQDDDGNITSDPNDADNDQFIPQLIERVTTVSLQTLEAIRSLPPALDFSPARCNRREPIS
jgi:hypothetical protein